MQKVRESLDYNIWLARADSIHLAARENLRLFFDTLEEPPGLVIQEQFAYFNSTGLLFGIALELVFKARILFEKRMEIESGVIIRFEQIRKEWKGNGHELEWLIDHYNIKITVTERKFIRQMQPYMIWAGRFPFPLKEEEILKVESGELKTGLPLGIDTKTEKIINKQRRILGSTTIMMPSF